MASRERVDIASREEARTLTSYDSSNNRRTCTSCGSSTRSSFVVRARRALVTLPKSYECEKFAVKGNNMGG